LLNSFSISVAYDEVDPFNILLEHEIYGIASSAANTKNLDDG
jgi:hypothetical protein